MAFILGIIQYFVDLGAAVMLPLVIILVALCLGEKPGKAIKSGISIGVGFIGIGLVIGLMLDNLAPAATAMSERFGIALNVIDVGWPGASPMTWASEIALVAIPVAIAVNIAMLALRMTKVVNIDIWNIWHYAFTGAFVYLATDNYMFGIIAVAIHAAFSYKLGDWFAPIVRDYFGLDGIAIPHGTSAYLGPIAVVVNDVIEKIPGLNKINFTTEQIQKRFGMLGDPAILGAIIGAAIAILAGYDLQKILALSMQMAAVIILMPQVIKHIMNGLLPVSEKAREVMSKKFKDSDYLIGLDPALLLGDSTVVTASLIFIPLTIVIAVLVPGNQVLPFGDLATIGFFVAMAVGIHKGNLFRTIISGFVIMFMTIWISNQTIGLHTKLAESVGEISSNGAQVASLDQGGAPITYILTQIVNPTNVIGLGAIVVIYGFCVIYTMRWSKKNK
ncbi:PTS system EIIC permease component [Erysipelotrichaceae bacterium]|nr:PTS system EIIC permease component [Erysipelotrichaceae bacterium]